MDPSNGWLPVGDACASHDPLCGWGVYRALTNGMLAADAIFAFLARGEPRNWEITGTAATSNTPATWTA